jgi:ferrous iron transport protein B
MPREAIVPGPAAAIAEDATTLPREGGSRRWLLVGAPNVGKSALFGRLTGAYATVSNYPGTSVEVAVGTHDLGDASAEVLDTPGMYGLLAVSEEERVARRALLQRADQTAVQVADASHLDRALPLTLQLIALGRPVVLACNLMDEARRRGVEPDVGRLAERLGVPVVGTVAVNGTGVAALAAAARGAAAPVDGWALPQPFADVVGLLCGDPEVEPVVAASAPALWTAAASMRDARWGGPEGFAVALATARRRMALALLDGVVPVAPASRGRRDARLDRVLLSPWTGLPLVALVLYLGFYRFVGSFGAGTLVDWIERVVFDQWLTPPVTAAVRAAVSWPPLADLVVGPYGLFTLAVRYAVAIVLPIVGTFFLVFALLEDCGYLPRLALLLDRGLKRLGLSGRAVIPLVLGFGCNTMATLVTRTLETRRERVIVTLLLALAIPCSAQLGVVLGILSVYPGAVAVWAGVLVGVFVVVGALAARLLPGEPPSFYLELPPLRAPSVRNVLLKTGTRVRWYFAEILPLFLLASALLWVGELTGALLAATHLLEPAVRAIGLPDAAAPAFLYGFFRRDFGAAGLYDLARAGALGPAALTTAAVTLTLFVPCVAQFLVMRRERGLRTAAAVLVTATVIAFAVGGGVGWLLRTVGGWA